MTRSRPFLALALVAVLGACGAPSTPPTPEPFAIGGTVVDLMGVPLPVNVTFMAALPEALTVTGLAPAAVNEFPNGTIELASTVLSADGAFELELPEGSAIPGAYLVDPTAFLVNPAPDVTCTATSSDEARVLRVFFDQGYGIPYTLLGPHNDLTLAIGLVFLGDGVPQFGAADVATYSWTYAQGPVSVAGSCVRDDGVNPSAVVGTWDLDLVEGWNRLRFAFDAATEETVIDTGTIDGARWRVLIP